MRISVLEKSSAEISKTEFARLQIFYSDGCRKERKIESSIEPVRER